MAWLPRIARRSATILGYVGRSIREVTLKNNDERPPHRKTPPRIRINIISVFKVIPRILSAHMLMLRGRQA